MTRKNVILITVACLRAVLKKTVIEEPVSLLDLASTILDFLNIENP